MRPYITDDLAGFADATIHFYRGISPLGTKAAARAPARGSRSHHWGLVLALKAVVVSCAFPSSPAQAGDSTARRRSMFRLSTTNIRACMIQTTGI